MNPTFEAVFENGVFRPLAAVPVAEGQVVRLQVQPIVDARSKTADEILALAASVYEGLSEEEINEIEAIAFDRSDFFHRRDQPS